MSKPTAIGSLCFIVGFAACTERASAQRPEPDVPRWLQDKGIATTMQPPDLPEPALPSTYASLDELAHDWSWECKPSRPGCSHTFWSKALPGPIWREARVIGVTDETACVWYFVARSDVGWVAPYQLGESVAGCTTRLDALTYERWSYWYPNAVTDDARGIRIEGQGQESGDFWEPTQDGAGKRRIDHDVAACRFEHNAIACGRTTAPGRQIHVQVPTAADQLPLAPRPDLLPLERIDDIGAKVAATFIGVPARAGMPAHLAVSHAQRDSVMKAWPLAGGRLVMLSFVGRPGWGDAGLVSLFFERGDTRTYLGLNGSNASNERLAVTVSEAREGLVRISFERTNAGDTTVTWRWEQLYVATTKGLRAYVLPSGMTLRNRESMIGGWWIDVQTSPEGVHLVEADGPLAWFRETGTFTWAALEAAIPRWQTRIAKAMIQEGERAPHLRAPRSTTREDGYQATLTLLPGYVEPINTPLVPEVYVVP